MAPDESKAESTVASNPSPTSAPAGPPFAWQPLTPRGLAAFATATFGRLFVVQLIVALLAASTVLWFLSAAWFPTVRDALKQLPETGVIRGQELSSPHPSAEPLAEGRFLALVVNVVHAHNTPSRADLRIEFHKDQIQICSLLGCLAVNYPRGPTWEFNRPELEPRWAAWEPMLLGLAFVGTVAWLFVSWFILATFYFLFVRVLAYFKDKKLTLGGSWRLAGAALMPGALLLTAGLLLYSLGAFGLIGLGCVAVLHFVTAWIYLILSLRVLPRIPAVASPSANPFSPPAPPPQTVA